jgi:hypothetical protein
LWDYPIFDKDFSSWFTLLLIIACFLKHVCDKTKWWKSTVKINCKWSYTNAGHKVNVVIMQFLSALHNAKWTMGKLDRGVTHTDDFQKYDR